MFVLFSYKVRAFVVNNSDELEAGGVNRILAAVRNNLFWLELTTDNFRGTGHSDNRITN